MSIPNIYSYIRLSSVFWEVCCIFCIATLCFLKIWCVFGSFMQSIFSQTEYCLETRFCSLPKGGVQHLKSIKPGLICTLVLKGYEGEKTLFSFYIRILKNIYVSRDLWHHEKEWTSTLDSVGRQFYDDSKYI